MPLKKPRGGTLKAADREYNRALAQVRIAVEHVLTRIRRFGALAQVWRHRRESHSPVFRVAAWLADRQIAALETTPQTA